MSKLSQITDYLNHENSLSNEAKKSAFELADEFETNTSMRVYDTFFDWTIELSNFLRSLKIEHAIGYNERKYVRITDLDFIQESGKIQFDTFFDDWCSYHADDLEKYVWNPVEVDNFKFMIGCSNPVKLDWAKMGLSDGRWIDLVV